MSRRESVTEGSAQLNTLALVVVVIALVALVALVATVLMGRALLKMQMRLAESEASQRGLENLAQAKEREFAAEREKLKSEFASLAERLLNEKQTELNGANARSVQTLFDDLKTKLQKYEDDVMSVSRSHTRMGSEMKTHVENLERLAGEAQKFTAALLGGNKIQGNQGELILSNILDRSGLIRDVNYRLQVGNASEGRPDVCVYDALNRHQIFIDAKMNIKDFVEAYNLPDDSAHREAKVRAMKAHVAGIRQQIKGLADRRYAETITPEEGYENLPIVAMFCPFDAVLEAALNVDPALIEYASGQNIVIVTPLTLWGWLRLVFCGWKQHNLERKQEEIRQLGGSVVGALDALLEDLATVGASLGKAQSAYESLSRRATEDKGAISVRRVAKLLLDCGVEPKGKLKQLGRETVTSDS